MTGKETVNKTSGWILPEGADIFNHWITGIAFQGDTPFEMPVITHVEGNLYQGGYVDSERGSPDLGDTFQSILSLYPWKRYKFAAKTEYKELELFDSHDSLPVKKIFEAARWVNEQKKKGKVLVHCQAGLNRSSLILAVALILEGKTPDEAIYILRDKRSPAVLCNPSFENFLRGKL